MPDPQSRHRSKTLEAIHDSAVDAIITIDECGLIETVNPATEQLLGYIPDELIGRNVSMLMPEPYRQEHDGYLQNYLESGIKKIIGIGREVVAKRKDGTTFPIHLAVSEVRLDDRRVFAGFIRDLTDVKIMEEREATLGRIIEDSLNEVYIFNVSDLRFVRVNRGARKNLGYSIEQLSKLTPVDLKPEYTEPEFRELISPLLNGKLAILEFNTIHERADGSTYHVEAHLQTSTYHAQPVFVAIILDVTEKLEAERKVKRQQQTMQAELEKLVDVRTNELRAAQAELIRNEKYATLGKVAGGIAHEIRNPLNAVKTSAYYLLNAKEPSATKVTEHLDRIDRQVTIIDNVITALSDVAKMPEAHLMPIAMEPLIRGVVNTTNLPASIRTVYEWPDVLPAVLADEHQIVIAFRNLIRNARDAMPDGGVITISVQREQQMVVFCVADNGVGISAHDLDRILEPLYTTKARGMGLGLSITRAIVEKNRGQLSVKSELEKGSAFSIALQVA